MLLQRTLCRILHKQITYSKSTSVPLHHARSQSLPLQRCPYILRSFRNSAQKKNATNSLQATPFDNYISGGAVPPGNVFRAFIFTGAFSVGCFMGATIMEYENARNMMLQKARQTKFAFFRRKTEEHGYLQNVKREAKLFWDQLTPGEKVFAPLCALNLIVFGLWRVPALRNTMTTYFCSNPVGRAVCWPMFLSTFSHYSVFHIFANMYVLHSFSNAAVMSLGKEQFLAVYLSAGVFASFTSILYKAITSQAGLSIGASGAIMAILAYVCTQYPDTQLSILFLPMLTFSAGAAIKVIMGIDLAGCLMGWKFFDHAAHLGGALYGVFWAYWGTLVWNQRIPLLTMYHDFRKTK